MTDWDPSQPTEQFGSPGPPSDEGPIEEVPQYVIEDIVRYVHLALAKHGVPGEVTCREGRLHLSTDGSGRSVPIFPWASRWLLTDENARERRATDAARFLAEGRRVSQAPPASRHRRFVFDVRLAILVGIIVACGAYVAWTSRAEVSTPGPRAEQSQDGSLNGIQKETTTTGRALDESRASKVCAATLTRIYQGGSVTVADVDGWRVELSFLRESGTEPLETHPALSKYLEAPGDPRGSRFIWPKEQDLAPLESSDTRVWVRSSSLGDGPSRVEGVTLSFGGALVDAYFTPETRNRYYHIANALSEDLSATHSALYARCFDGETHALGSWFRGLDPQGAATAVVYFMGTFASPLHIAKPYYSTPADSGINRLHAFRSIDEKTLHVSRSDLATIVGSEGGMAIGKPQEPVIITFPFQDGNRASRTSRSLSRVVSLGL